MNNVTILYYTSNRENPVMEESIRANILARSGGLPIISVSQKPIDFGENICVGKRKQSYWNEFKQIQIGLRKVKTEYVLVAESDFLYPNDYFTFKPGDKSCYRYRGVWVCYLRSPRWVFLKQYSDGAQMVRTKDWLAHLDTILNDEWDKDINLKNGQLRSTTNPDNTWGEETVITIKTDKNTSERTSIRKPRVTKTNLQPWGNIKELMTKLCA